jgi:hypothetical protein
MELMTIPFKELNGQSTMDGKHRMVNSLKSVAVTTNRYGVLLIANTSITEKELLLIMNKEPTGEELPNKA